MADFEADLTETVGYSDALVYDLIPVPVEIYIALKPKEVYDPSWTPDGELIFVEHIRATYKISTMNVDTLAKTTIYTTTSRLAEPTMSPDGFFILFGEQVSVDGTYGTWRLRFMSADGTSVATILDDGNANLHPSWVTPTQIAFQWWSDGATPSSEFQVALIDLVGRGRVEMGEGEYPRLVVI